MTLNAQRSNKNWLVAAATVAAAAILPMTQTSTVSADDTKDNGDSHTSWRAKTVEDVKSVLLTAGKEYQVQSGDTLSTISEAAGESVDDIAAANGVSDIHMISVGEVLKLDVDGADKATTSQSAEVQKPVAQATPQTQAVETPQATQPVAEKTAMTTQAVAPEKVAAPTYNTAGNSYPAGQCTWFVKNALSWVGNNWGNASGWASSAAAAGRVVNGQPAVGSVVVFAPGELGAGALGHVAVVDAVNGNSVSISEGNYAGMAYHTRTISASGLTFIH
jgi:surface antigen